MRGNPSSGCEAGAAWAVKKSQARASHSAISSSSTSTENVPVSGVHFCVGSVAFGWNRHSELTQPSVCVEESYPGNPCFGENLGLRPQNGHDFNPSPFIVPSLGFMPVFPGCQRVFTTPTTPPSGIRET